MRLHGYFRSTASWRVRIALNLKGVEAEHEAHHLRHGAQRAADYLRLNPQGLVPTLELDDGTPLTQSLAICEWLEETRPNPPLLPGGALERAKIRAFAFSIACDVHPVQNLRVLERLRAMKISEDDVTAWARSVIADGLDACQKLLAPTRRGRSASANAPRSPTFVSSRNSSTPAASAWTSRASTGCRWPRPPAKDFPPSPPRRPNASPTPNRPSHRKDYP